MEQVHVTTLDRFVDHEGLTRLDLVKIDIEGAERRFLKGAARTLVRFRPIIMVELSPATLEVFGESSEGLIRDLEEAGYALHLPARRGLVRLRRLPFRGQHLNVIGLPREAA